MKIRNFITTRATIALFCSGLVMVGAASNMMASPYSSAVNALSPLSYWQFAEATGSPGTPIPASTVSNDDGSLGNNGSYLNGTSLVGAGVDLFAFPGMTGSNNSVNFPNVANQITGSDSGLPTGNADRSWIGWVKTTDNGTNAGGGGTGSGYRDVFSYGSPGGGNMLFTLVPPWNGDSNLNGTPDTPGNFGVSQYGDGIGTNVAINDGDWHFLAWTSTDAGGGNANFRLYVDGVFQVQKVMANNTVLSGTYYLANDSLNDPYFGEFAQQAIFSGVLSDGQIAALYAVAVPEPTSLSLLAVAGLGLLRVRRRAG